MAGIDAHGTAFHRGDGVTPTEAFTAVANVNDITPPALERNTLDVTAHDSPDAWMEFIGGLKDGGEVSLSLNYDPDKHDTLVADFDDDAPRSYRVVWPTAVGGHWEFKAIMTGFAAEAPHDDKLSAEVTFKVTGKPTLTAGA